MLNPFREYHPTYSVQEVTSGSTAVLDPGVDVVIVNKTTGGATSVPVPKEPHPGRAFAVIDGKGDANSNNITITTPGDETINGASTYVMNANRESVILVADASGNWFVLASFGE